MSKKYYGIINGKHGSGIFHGEWSQIEPLVKGIPGAKQTPSDKHFEAAKSKYEAKTNLTVDGYYDFNKSSGEFEWQALSSSEEHSSDKAIDNLPTEIELANLKASSNEKKFIMTLNTFLSKYSVSSLINNQSEAPIHWAAANGYCDAIYVLLGTKIDINLQDMWGETPLHKAVKNGHYKAVECLLTSGAKKSIRKKGAGNELPINLVRNLTPQVRKKITDQFTSIHTGTFKVKFEGDTISEIIFKKRYSSNIVLGTLQEQQPELCEETTTASSGFKVKEGYQICHKKSDYTICNEIKAELIGKKYEDVIKLIRKKGIKNSDLNDRLEAVELIFEYYKNISADPENLFIDLKDRNGAFGFLSSIVEKYDAADFTEKKYFEISKAHYPYLKNLEALHPAITYDNGKHYLIAFVGNIEILRKLADGHFDHISTTNKQSEKNKVTKPFSEHYNNSGSSTHFKRKPDEKTNTSIVSIDTPVVNTKKNKHP